MKESEYKCSVCNEVYEKGWSDEEAMAESESIFGKHDDLEVVCDDCFNKMVNVPDEEDDSEKEISH
jgi:hypothetical protein